MAEYDRSDCTRGDPVLASLVWSAIDGHCPWEVVADYMEERGIPLGSDVRHMAARPGPRISKKNDKTIRRIMRLIGEEAV
jgi:hypothetical protein